MTRVDTHERHVIEVDASQLEVCAEEVDDATLRVRCTFELRVPRHLPARLPADVDVTLVHPDAGCD
jgi:hypothetical protein